ncbi:hypothetical protein OTU49_006073 [Cherax quadricarinatus]|uniref:C2H2-type domain-containing protein n=1 Tax=Cherax quadricarinatus TaxID=27406 RepID=A0AAW0X485_CHEQU
MVVLKTDYSSCPLKKRPFSLHYNTTGCVQSEPEDLSVKCEGEMHATPTRTHEPGVYNPHAPLRTREPQVIRKREAQAIRPKELRDATQCGLDFERIRVRGSHAHVEATQAQSTQVRELCVPGVWEGVPDARAICVQTTTALPCIAQEPERRERGSMGSDRLSRASEVDSLDRNQHLPILDTRNTMTTTHRTLTCRSTPSPTRAPSRVGHTSLTSKVAEPSSGIVSSPAILGRLPALEGSSDRASPCPGQLPTVQTTASRLGFSEDGQETQPTSALTQPHRPWLADDPPKHMSQLQFSEVPVPLQPARPRPLLANSSLWAGMVPLGWPMPHLLTPAQTLTHGRHRRECGSPGSESASSDSSSGRGEARYSCSDCSKSYSTYSGLSKHKQFHCAALGAKSFSCKHCDKVYTSLGALKMHIRTHTLPCKCHLCGKAFSRPWLLQGHIRTHTGEKPFQCPQCDRCFADRSNLRAHLQTHADIKKYACVTCHKTFSRMSLLNKHTEAACPARPHQHHP